MTKNTASVSKKTLTDMIHRRSLGETISQTAHYLDVKPWTVSYLTRFIRVCVTNDEFKYLVDLAESHHFGTVGEFIMDVFHRTYESHYVPMVKKARRKKSKIAAVG